MTTTLPRKVAVVGAGEIGCGWAALCASAGWPVTIYDGNARSLELALTEVPRRARALVALERATAGIVERGLLEHDQGRSLLLAVRDADWIIEAIHEDLVAKQKVLGAIDEAAGPDALLTSSSSGLRATDLFALCRRQDRALVAHPLNPPELIPLVELVPGAHTTRAGVARAQEYLRALGRMPIVIKKEVPGYVVGRIAAAVWRECVDLIQRGVIDVDDLDRAISLGPALGWAAAGPHLTNHLNAGAGGVEIFLQRLLNTFEGWWEDLAAWRRLEPEKQWALIQTIEKTYSKETDRLRAARDRRLSAILRALESAREATA